METRTEGTEEPVTLCHNWHILLYICQDGRAFHSSYLGMETCGDSRCHFNLFCDTVLANFAIVPEDVKQTLVHEALSLSLELFAMLGDHHSPRVCVKLLLSEPPQELELLNPEFP